jgi:ankyrin repeat protein
MSEALPSRPNLGWLRKTAKQHLKDLRTRQPDATLADAQFTLARRYGFSSWRSLKVHVENATLAGAMNDAEVAAFLHAVGSGQLDAVRSILTATPPLVNAAGPHPYWEGRPQALHVAIETSRRDMFDVLLAAGADIDSCDEHYQYSSPLMLAITWKQPEMQQELLAHGARIGLVEALLLADDDRVERMLRRGKSALPSYQPNGGSLLAMARTAFAIDRLLELGVARDERDRWGAAPIEALSALGARGIPLVRHLLARGFAASPQEYAKLGDRETLTKLIQADPAIVESEAVLVNAAAYGHHALVQWLLARGANPSARSRPGAMTALHSAAWEGDLRMVKLLVEAGADLSAREDGHNATPVGFARVAIEVTNNAACREVAEYLEGVQRARAQGRPPD